MSPMGHRRNAYWGNKLFYRLSGISIRGSPHIHALFWVKDAPQYEQNANEEIIHFVDK